MFKKREARPGIRWQQPWTVCLAWKKRFSAFPLPHALMVLSFLLLTVHLRWLVAIWHVSPVTQCRAYKLRLHRSEAAVGFIDWVLRSARTSSEPTPTPWARPLASGRPCIQRQNCRRQGAARRLYKDAC